MSCGGSFANCGTCRDGIDKEWIEATPDEDNVVVEGVASVVKSHGLLLQRNILVQKRVGGFGVGVNCGWL